MMRFCFLLVLLLATPAAAQDLAPDAAATLIVGLCPVASPEPRIPEAEVEAAGLARVVPDEGGPSFVSPGGTTLDYAAREGFAACTLTLPEAPDGYTEALGAALSAAIGARFEIADAETVEDGQIWRWAPAPGLRARAEIRVEPPRVAVTASVERGALMEDSE